MLVVETARISYGGPDKLNVTRGSGGPLGNAFAPSHDLLARYMESIRVARRIETDAEAHEKTVSQARPDMTGLILKKAKIEAEEARARAFEAYAPEFLAEMRESYVKNRRLWHTLLAKGHVVFVCYCVDPERCHRFLLRTKVFPKLGAVDGGELPLEAQRRVAQPKGIV